MNALRKLMGFLVAAALVAFALPASADNKIFAVTLPSSVDAGTSRTISIVFNNLADGNSSFNSVSASAASGPSGGSVIITAATTSSPKKGQVSGLGTSSIQITGLSPTQVGNSLTVTLTVTATGSGCTAGSVDWSFDAWTGSPGTPSNHFAIQPPGTRSMSISNGCNYSLSGIPTTVVAGSTSNLSLTLANLAPSTGPSITQFVLTVPAGFTIPTQTPPSNVSINYLTNTVTVNRTVAAGGGSSGSTTFALTVQANSSCTGPSSANWGASVTVPSGFGITPTSNLTTSITAQSCSMEIVPPSSAVVNISFNVTVNLIGGPGGATVTLSGCGIDPVSATAGAGSNSVTIPVTITSLPSGGTCTLTATGNSGYGTATFPGFRVFAGELDCGLPYRIGSLDPLNDDLPIIGDPDWGLVRGLNMNNATCKKVPYLWTVDQDTKSFVFLVDKLAVTDPPQLVSVVYVIRWAEVADDSSNSLKTLKTWVSWGVANPVYPADFVPAPKCVGLDQGSGGLGPDHDVLAYPANNSIMPNNPDDPEYQTRFASGNYPQYEPVNVRSKMCEVTFARASVGGSKSQYLIKIVDQSDGFGGIR